MSDSSDETIKFSSEKEAAKYIITGYLSGGEPPYDGWHHIDNAYNDLLREIIKQLVVHALVLREELATHGWGDFHYGQTPQEPRIVELLQQYRSEKQNPK